MLTSLNFLEKERKKKNTSNKLPILHCYVERYDVFNNMMEKQV
jgi:hypothetical protein